MNGMVKLRPWASDVVYVKGKKVRTEEWIPKSQKRRKFKRRMEGNK